MTFVEPIDWRRSTGGATEGELARIGGILLIMGILHAANVVALPVIGGLLSSNKRLEEPKATPPATQAAGVVSTGSIPPLGPGTWILRIEPAPGSSPADPDASHG